MKKFIWLSFSLAIVFVLIHSLFFTSTASTGGSTSNQPTQKLARLSPEVTVHAVGEGNPLINLGNGRELLTSYEGSSNAQLALNQNLARPTALASADFDEDGTADLIAGYAGPSGGILTIHRGNVDAIYPNSPEAKQRKAEGVFTESPFIAPALVLELPEAPDFVATGDFDADGHWDVATAAKASSSLYLLSGDGHGNFSSPKTIDLPGGVSVLRAGEINRADGLIDIVVAVVAEQGAQVLVFEGPRGALRSVPEAFRVAAPATEMVLGRLSEDYLFDLAVAVGPSLLVVEGRDRKLSLDTALQSEVPEAVIKERSLAFNVSAMSVGDFDGEAGEELALLAEDGTLHLLKRDVGLGKKGVGNLAEWSTRKLSAVARPGASQLITSRVSSTGRDDLVIADSNNQLHVVTNEMGSQGASAETLNVDGGAAAVLPMRLNSDAISDLVILRNNQVAPSIIDSPQGPQATFTVINTADSGAGSLRQAILDANASMGLDTISFSIGSGAQTIIPLTPLPTITDPVVIDGTTQPGFAGTPIIELSGTGVPNGTDGLLITGGGTTIRGLVINRFLNGDAIQIQTNGANIVEGNFLGTNLSGNTSDAGRVNRTGVFINGPPNNRIGGTTNAARNLVSGNSRGIDIFGTSSSNTTGNLVQGNFIGTDVAGTADLGNVFSGVNFSRATFTTIGGTVPGARNIISGNGNHGIGFDVASGNLVQGNLIGTDVNGTVDLGNSFAGVLVTNASANNTLGGTTPAARNIVSGNNTYGFQIRAAGTNGNLVQGNYIGTNSQGTAAIGNSLDGVAIESSSNTIGGETETARNIISGNGQNGISIFTDISSITGITVRNNYIGTAVDGVNCLGNFRDGIFVNRGSIGHTITDNRIACNGRNGVNIPNVPTNDPGVRIEVTDNFIFANGALGIDLGDPGITPNDPLDADVGANLQQNFPELLSFTPLAPSEGRLPLQPDSAQVAVTVNATLHSTPNTDFTVHWYFTADAQCAMNQQGSQPLVFGRKPVTTGADGNAPFNFEMDFPAGITNGVVNCTATDSLGNTSEFSACLPVTAAPAADTVQFTSGTASVNETLDATTKVDLNVTRSGNTAGPATVNYASSDGTASDRSDYTTAAGTLRFAAGETTKTISVFIVDDAFGETPETFNVTLSSPIGASLGSPATIEVTINSNEAVDGPNPVRDPGFSSDFFVRQHYVDFFNREADAPGLAFWKNQIDECTTQACREIRRINVSAAFYVSIEFQQTGYLVYKAYQAAFNSGEQLDLREFLPDTQEIGRGVVIGQPGADMQLETNKQNFFLDFVQRPAFLAPGAYPTTLTANQFVDKLNGNTFDPLNPGSGALTPTERQHLIDELTPDPASPTLRAEVLRSVSENGVFSQRQFNKAFVLMQYIGYLRRNPDATPDTNFDGYNFWLGKLNQFNGNFVEAEMVKAFITSGEYIQRFGP